MDIFLLSLTSSFHVLPKASFVPRCYVFFKGKKGAIDFFSFSAGIYKDGSTGAAVYYEWAFPPTHVATAQS